MIKRENIIEELSNRGYHVELHTSIKNGIEMNGIRFILESGMCPVIYTDEIINDSVSTMEAVKMVLGIYNSADNMEFDKNKITDPNFILENLYIGLQKTSNENIIKKETDFEGIEKYLYVKIDDNSSFKLTCALLEALKANEEDIWNAAEDNTFAQTKIVSLSEILSGMTGQEIEELHGIPKQYIVGNTMNFRGASAILDMAALKNFANELGVHKFIMLPSSIHEMIIIPNDGNGNAEEFNAMVKEVNETQVEPEERLTDQAYIIEV